MAQYPLKEIWQVEWEDACSSGGWRSRDSYCKEGLLPTKTIGFFLKKSRKSVTLLQNQARNGILSDSMSIPRSQILKVYKYRVR